MKKSDPAYGCSRHKTIMPCNCYANKIHRLESELNALRDENKELKLNLATHSPCAENFHKMMHEAHDYRQLAERYRSVFHEIEKELAERDYGIWGMNVFKLLRNFRLANPEALQEKAE